MSQFGALWQSVSSTAVDAAELESGTAPDGYVLTADGSGGAAWEAASGGGDAADLTSGTATDGYVLTADGAGGAAWEAVPAVDSTSLILLTALAFGAL